MLDNTVLNLAVPTILRDFHTQLSSLQWVITGYSLTFATLLIIGGRLGDIFGHRRMFVFGAAIFGVGSFLASISTSVPTLFVGEALIEGIGASMMIPATLSILSTTFKGAERPKAFAAWGAVAGAAVAFGPIVGGFLTTDYSWRWAFRINVIVAPIIVVGALLFMHPDERSARRPHIDVRGAALIATGSFSLIFGLSEGTTYGWWNPIKDLTVGNWNAWPASRPVSVIPFAFVLATVAFTAFVVVERSMERANRDPLFEFGQLRHLGFRYGLLTTMVLAMGQFGLLFILPVLLQNGEHLSALRAGEWMLPQGVLIARCAHRRPADPSLQHHEHRAHRPRARSDRAAVGGARDLAARLVPRAAAGNDRVRPRRRVRELAADQRDPVGHRSRQGGRGRRHEHHGPPGRSRARHRDVRVVHRRVDP